MSSSTLQSEGRPVTTTCDGEAEAAGGGSRSPGKVRPCRRLERGGGAAEVDRSRFVLLPLLLVMVVRLVLIFPLVESGGMEGKEIEG